MKKTLLASSIPAACALLIGGAYALTPGRERLDPGEFDGGGTAARVGGYDLRFSDDGPPDAPVVVLLHGFLAWSFSWRAQRAALLQAGFRVIAIDLLGYGGSSRPAAPVYTTSTQAELALGVLDACGVQAAHVAGHSFGGRVAMQMAILAPERVRSLIAAAPEGFATTRPPDAIWARPPLIGYAFSFYFTAPRLVRAGLKLVARRHDWITDDVVAGYAAPLYVRGSVAAQVWQARSPKDGAQPVPYNLSAITQPTLLLWGADDPVFPASDGQKLADILADARLHVFHGVGHLPHEEARDRATEAMLGFLLEKRLDMERGRS